MCFIFIFLENFRIIDIAFDVKKTCSNSQIQGSKHRANNATCTENRWLKKFKSEINISGTKTWPAE